LMLTKPESLEKCPIATKATIPLEAEMERIGLERADEKTNSKAVECELRFSYDLRTPESG